MIEGGPDAAGVSALVGAGAAVALLGAGSCDAEQVAYLSPRALLGAGVGDGDGQEATDFDAETGQKVHTGAGVSGRGEIPPLTQAVDGGSEDGLGVAAGRRGEIAIASGFSHSVWVSIHLGGYGTGRLGGVSRLNRGGGLGWSAGGLSRWGLWRRRRLSLPGNVPPKPWEVSLVQAQDSHTRPTGAGIGPIRPCPVAGVGPDARGGSGPCAGAAGSPDRQRVRRGPRRGGVVK